MSRLFTTDGDVVLVAPATEINNLEQRTYAVWVKLTSGLTGLIRTIWGRGANTFGKIPHDGVGDFVDFKLDADTDANAGSNEYGIPPVDKWTHIAVTIDNTGSREFIVYIDGATIDQYSTAAAGTMADDSAVNLAIGNTGAAGTSEFRGRIYDFRLYDSILTETEIDFIKARGHGYDPQPTHNKCHLTFATDQGSPEPDASGNENTGAITVAAFSADNPGFGRVGNMTGARFLANSMANAMRRRRF